MQEGVRIWEIQLKKDVVDTDKTQRLGWMYLNSDFRQNYNILLFTWIFSRFKSNLSVQLHLDYWPKWCQFLVSFHMIYSVSITELSQKNMRMQIIRNYVKGADQITDNTEKHIRT